MTYVFDTYALMVHFRREDGYVVVDGLLRRVLAGTDDAHISVINLGELYYMLHRSWVQPMPIDRCSSFSAPELSSSGRLTRV